MTATYKGVSTWIIVLYGSANLSRSGSLPEIMIYLPDEGHFPEYQVSIGYRLKCDTRKIFLVDRKKLLESYFWVDPQV